MKSTQQVALQHEHLLNTVAQSGRNIEPCVYSAAQRMADHAVSYAEKFLGDSCVAVNLLEEAAATVSEAIHAKEAEGIAPIRDMHRYIFRVFLRKVAEARRAVQYILPVPSIPISAMTLRLNVWIASYFWTRFWGILTALRER